MGCEYSTPQRPFFRRSDGANNTSENGSNSKIFDVINVDDRGNEINHGRIEITENDLILHQKNKNSIVWPLRSLRRYGFDAELFSFECGRRCSTGPGIYAFKCVHAEQLFNVLQESLQHCSIVTTPNHFTNQETNRSNSTTVVSPVTPSAGPPELAARAPVQVPSQPTVLPNSPPHSYVNDIRSYINSPFYANKGVSNGAIVGLPVSSFPHMNISKGHTGSARSSRYVNTNYAKLDDHVDYVNIDTTIAQFQAGTSTCDSTTITTPTTNVTSNAESTSSTITTSSGNANNNNVSNNPEMEECPSAKRRTSLNFDEAKLSHIPNDGLNCSSSNVKSLILPNKPLSALVPSSCSSSSITSLSSSSSCITAILNVTSSHLQQSETMTSPRLHLKSEKGISESIELTKLNEPVNYIVLDLENTNTNNNGATYVTTGPATPVFKTPEEGSFILPGTTPPSTPTSIKFISSHYPPQSYTTIDFDKTIALSNSSANHRKF